MIFNFAKSQITSLLCKEYFNMVRVVFWDFFFLFFAFTFATRNI